MLHILEHTLSHTIEDSVKLLPFLFFTYLLMELLEHTTGGKVQNKIKDAGKVGPLWGGLLGIMPQCGFRQQRPAFMPDESLRWERCLPYFCPRRMRCCRFSFQSQSHWQRLLKFLQQKSALRSFQDFLQNWFM